MSNDTQNPTQSNNPFVAQPGEQVMDIPVGQVFRGPNDRTVFKEESLLALGQSIKDKGQVQPCLVRPKAGPNGELYELIAGERRWRACTAVGVPTIKAIIRDLPDEDASSLMALENLQREDLDPLDMANMFDSRMRRFNWSVERVARELNQKPSLVRERLALLKLAPEIQDLLRKGQLALSWANLLTALSRDRQHAAMTYITKNERPNFFEFQEVCGQLLAQQAQDAQFSFALAVETVDAATEKVRERVRKGTQSVWPMASDLPELKRHKSMGMAIEGYLAQLLESDSVRNYQAACDIGFMYYEMIRLGIIYPPDLSSPLRDWAKRQYEAALVAPTADPPQEWVSSDGQALPLTLREMRALLATAKTALSLCRDANGWELTKGTAMAMALSVDLPGLDALWTAACEADPLNITRANAVGLLHVTLWVLNRDNGPAVEALAGELGCANPMVVDLMRKLATLKP